MRPLKSAPNRRGSQKACSRAKTNRRRKLAHPNSPHYYSGLTTNHQLILNAGLGVGKYWETTDGLDSHFQVNHLSQLHLLFHLLSNLRQTPNSRVVLQSSDLHRASQSSVEFASVEEINTDIGPTNLYNRTKLAQVLTVHALVQRIDQGKLGFKAHPAGAAPPIYINAVHPGGVATDQPAQAVEAYGTLGKIGVTAAKPFLKDPVKEGCRPALYAATSEEIIEKQITGSYIIPDKKVTDPSSQSKDEQLQERLWQLSVGLLKEKLGGPGGKGLDYGFEV